MSTSLRERYGPLALVTGASSGIGEQFARLLAESGFDLLLTARSEEKLQALRRELERDFGVSVAVLICDLSNLEEVDALVAKVREAGPSLLISNAGYGVAKGPYLDTPIEDLEAMFRANAIAPARLVRDLLPDLVAAGRGGVIFTGSIEGDAAFPMSTGYAASKAFLHSLAHGLWFEVQRAGVDVLLLAPGSTDTEAPIKQGISRDQLVGLMSPRDVASQALGRLGRGPHFIPKAQNRIFIALLRLLPRRVAIKLAGVGMKQAMERSAASIGGS